MRAPAKSVESKRIVKFDGQTPASDMGSETSMDRPIAKRGPGRKILTLLGIAGLLLLASWLVKENQGSAYTLDGQRIRTAVVSQGTYEDFIPLRASVEPERSVFLDAVEGGRVERLMVEQGALVEAGQVLLELSNTNLQLDVIAREAEVSEQLNNLRNSELAIEQNRLSLKSELIEIDYQIQKLTRLVSRYQTLENNGFISQTEFEDAADELAYWRLRRDVTLESQAQEERMRQAQIAQLQSSVSQLESNLVLARGNLDNLVVRAPRSGRLTAFDAEVGETKARGESLGQIDDIDTFKTSALVNEFYLSRVRVGQRATMMHEGSQYELSISKVYPEVISAQFRVDMAFIGPTPGNIRRGQTLQVKLSLGDDRETAILLDNGPFLNDTGGAWVFVLSKDRSVATKRDISLGRRNPNHVEVLSGLVPGDEVVISTYSTFSTVDQLLIN